VTRKRSAKKSRPKGFGKKDIRRFELLGGSATVAAGALVVVMFLMASAMPYTFTMQQSAAVVVASLVKLANGDRADEGLSALTVSPRLTAVAQAKADDMAARGYFAHTSPDGKDPWYWFAQEKYAFQYAGENLAVDFSDSIDVEKAWMNSPMHRKNILDPHYTEIGIATAVGEYEGHRTVFVVQVFGMPASKPQPVVAETVPNDPEVLAVAETAPAAEGETQVLGADTKVVVEESAPAAETPVIAGPLEQVISSPKNSLRTSYYVLGALILLALAYATRFEMKKHHIRHATAAGGLILLMGLLFLLANFVVFTPPTISETAAAAQARI